MADTFKLYEGNEPYIFVSYARKDRETVLSAIEALAGAGYRVWYDDAIEWTEEWPDKIAGRLAGSAVCLAFHSAASAASRHCKAELHYAMKNERPVMSVYLEEIRLPQGLEMYLDLYQAVKWSDFTDAEAFVERLGREEAFKPCREDRERWHRVGRIQWKLDHQGVLTIASYKRLSSDMPDFGDVWNDAAGAFIGSTAPWMEAREEIRVVEIQEGIGNIGDRAFKGCTGLERAEILYSMAGVGAGAFRDCRNLSHVDLPPYLYRIGIGAFRGCAALTDITIPNGVATIGDFAFSGCSGLTSITIPNSVTTIGNRAFEDCAGVTSLTIPNSVTTIGDFAFAGCTDLTSVTIPDSVTSISYGAFVSCAGLTSITIPDSVTTIGNYAFISCEALTKVEIPTGAELGTGAFPEHVEIIRRPAHRDDP